MDKSRYSFDKYKEDKIRAIDARFEAQKIAFSPLTFQAIRALIELGILNLRRAAPAYSPCPRNL